MKKKLESLSTAQLDTTTGGYGFGFRGGWAVQREYREERYEQHYEQRWAAVHPYAASRFGYGY